MKTFTYDIPRELVDTIQAKQMETTGLKELYNSALTSPYEIPEEKIERLEKKFIEANLMYELAKSEVEKFFGSEVNKGRATWNLDFNTGVCTVTVNE